jgi:hypothetical protein
MVISLFGMPKGYPLHQQEPFMAEVPLPYELSAYPLLCGCHEPKYQDKGLAETFTDNLKQLQ